MWSTLIICFFLVVLALVVIASFIFIRWLSQRQADPEAVENPPHRSKKPRRLRGNSPATKLKIAKDRFVIPSKDIKYAGPLRMQPRVQGDMVHVEDETKTPGGSAETDSTFNVTFDKDINVAYEVGKDVEEYEDTVSGYQTTGDEISEFFKDHDKFSIKPDKISTMKKKKKTTSLTVSEDKSTTKSKVAETKSSCGPSSEKVPFPPKKQQKHKNPELSTQKNCKHRESSKKIKASRASIDYEAATSKEQPAPKLRPSPKWTRARDSSITARESLAMGERTLKKSTHPSFANRNSVRTAVFTPKLFTPKAFTPKTAASPVETDKSKSTDEKMSSKSTMRKKSKKSVDSSEGETEEKTSIDSLQGPRKRSDDGLEEEKTAPQQLLRSHPNLIVKRNQHHLPD